MQNHIKRNYRSLLNENCSNTWQNAIAIGNEVTYKIILSYSKSFWAIFLKKLRNNNTKTLETFLNSLKKKTAISQGDFAEC